MLQAIKAAGNRPVSSRTASIVAMVTATFLLVGTLFATSGLPFGGMGAVAEANREVSALPQNPACRVWVTADGNTTELTLTEGTVETVLKLAGITLGEDDELNVALTDKVTDQMEICVNRVMYRERTEVETVAYKTTATISTSLKTGESKVTQKGVNGETQRVYREKLVNGKVTETTKVSEKVLKKPVNEVVLKGKSVVKVADGDGKNGHAMSAMPYAIELDANRQPKKYTKVYTGTATAYTSDRGNSGTVTSTGAPAQVGIVAVDPSVIPYGTELYIVSADGSYVYGYAIAGDTGGAMRAGEAMVDLFMNTYEECIAFGRRTMNFYVIG